MECQELQCDSKTALVFETSAPEHPYNPLKRWTAHYYTLTYSDAYRMVYRRFVEMFESFGFSQGGMRSNTLAIFSSYCGGLLIASTSLSYASSDT